MASYLVSQLAGRSPGVQRLAQEGSKALGMPLVPWAAVAARLPPDPGLPSVAQLCICVCKCWRACGFHAPGQATAKVIQLLTGVEQATWLWSRAVSQLAAACGRHSLAFLPLPVRTGLPCHVNAFFELSTNRRDIWYGADLQGAGKLRSDWNAALLQVRLSRSAAAVAHCVQLRAGCHAKQSGEQISEAQFQSRQLAAEPMCSVA